MSPDAESRCPVCTSGDTTVFLRRNGVPVHQNLLCPDRGSAVNLARGNLSMAVCRRCGFIFNRDFDGQLLNYSQSYQNSQICSPTFNDHVASLLEHLLKEEDVNGCNIVEIGCGKGYFIRSLVDDGAGNTGTGYDPSYEGETEAAGGRLRFEKKIFDGSCSHVCADVAVCRHVIEHIPEPVKMLNLIRRTLPEGGRAYFEMPCAEWILKNKVFWDFFYEHCSLFTSRSLLTALKIAGFDDVKVWHVFGGQYLWAEATATYGGGRCEYDSDGIVPLAIEYGQSEKQLIFDWKRRVEKALLKGPVAVWGAGAKGATFLSLVDPQATAICCNVEINPNKQGNFVPGTGHEIVSPDAIKTCSIRSIIVMNPNYKNEIEYIIHHLNKNVELF